MQRHSQRCSKLLYKCLNKLGLRPDLAAERQRQPYHYLGDLVLRYQLKPGHNVYKLETRLGPNYPTVPPETRVLTPLKHCPHLLEGQTLCMWRQGSTRVTSRWDPAKFTGVFAIQAAWRWLACYEIWHETGEWPLPEAK